MKHLLQTAELTPELFRQIIDLAAQYKSQPLLNYALLRGQSIMLYFNKPSTRTRLSCETAIIRLGGVPISCNSQELQLGRGETIADTARVVGRYCGAFIIRTFDHTDVEQFAAFSTVPVINALTNLHHPLQSLADMLTLKEKLGGWRGKKIAYVGDGNNNVTHSLLQAAALMGMNITIASPNHYAPQPEILKHAEQMAKIAGGEICFTSSALAAVKNADAIYTDVWVSMGTPEAQRAERLIDLMPYQVNTTLMAHAKPNAIFMHCLPAHRGEEVTAEIIDNKNSVVFDQAENRLVTTQALLSILLQG